MYFTTMYTMHAPNQQHLARIVQEMKVLGAPTIRVVDCGDHYVALEGTHRIAAAAQLGISLILDVLEEDDLVPGDSLDWQDFLQPGQEYTAGELAGEVQSINSGIYLCNEAGVWEENMPRAKARTHEPR